MPFERCFAEGSARAAASRLALTLAVGGALAAITAVPAAGAGAPGQDNRAFTSVFPNDTVLASEGANYFWGPMVPGYVQVLENTSGSRHVVLTITVTNKTLVIDNVETRIVEERVVTDGVLSELAINYMAISKKTNSVYYFGEDSSAYKNGGVSHKGSWTSGAGGAKYGMLMPGVALLGARFMQEIAPGVALDRSEIIAEGATITTPAGTFTNCLTVQDGDGLHPGAPVETKTYCPGIGIVQDDNLFLTRFGRRG